MSDYLLATGVLVGLNIMMALGLNVISGYAGQPHLGIMMYTSIGAYVSAVLLLHTPLPFAFVIAIAIAAAFVFGVATGLPALRVGNDFLAVLTIGLVFVVESLYAYLPQQWLGGPMGLMDIPKPRLFGHGFDTPAMFALVAACTGLCLWMSWRLARSWLGLAWQSVREDELASRVTGTATARIKIIAFAVGAACCGLAGSLYAQFMGSVSPADFGFLPSLFIVTMINLGGVGTIRGAVAGAVLLSVLPELFRFVQEYRNLIYGSLLVSVMLYQPAGLLGDDSVLWRVLSRVRTRPRSRHVSAPRVVPAPALVDTPQSPCTLEVREVSVRFGGLQALDHVSLQVKSGEILGVIGPNGAGKTTLFNTISGVYRPATGGVYLDGDRLDVLPPHEIARRGVGRTFQIVRPFPQLSVLSNVLVPYGARHYAAGLAMLARYDSEMSRQPARQLLELTGLAAYGHAPAGTLPLGLLRRLEIARVLALDARVILLDESFSGLSPEEIGSQKKLVLALRQQGKAVVLIEHNMEIAMEICDRLSVLNFGRTLAEGTPAEIRNNPAVIEAYLGEG